MRHAHSLTDSAACRTVWPFRVPLLLAALGLTTGGYAHVFFPASPFHSDKVMRPEVVALHEEQETTDRNKHQDSVPEWLAELKDSGPTARLNAVHRLADSRDKRAVEPLIELLSSDPNPEIRRAAAFALGQLGDPRAVGPLIASLKDQDPGVCLNSIFAVTHVQGPERTNALIASLAHKDLHVCRAAAVGLVLLGDKNAVPLLIRSLNDNRLTVRTGAAYALGFLAAC